MSQKLRSDDQGKIYDESGEAIGFMVSTVDARRIVACVNACEGIGAESLDLVSAPTLAASVVSGIEKQRDELLAALSAEHGGDNYEPECELCHLVDKVKGGA